jgi:hypothetical protein
VPMLASKLNKLPNSVAETDQPSQAPGTKHRAGRSAETRECADQPRSTCLSTSASWASALVEGLALRQAT